MNQTDRQIKSIISAFLTFCALAALVGVLLAIWNGYSPTDPPPDRPDYQAPVFTFDHYPDTIRYLIGPSGFEVWEFRTPTGTRCMLSQDQESAASSRALSCQWRPSPEY